MIDMVKSGTKARWDKRISRRRLRARAEASSEGRDAEATMEDILRNKTGRKKVLKKVRSVEAEKVTVMGREWVAMHIQYC